ncbi:MAG: homoserine O-acetyltransferase [Nitrospirae bacterium]|nr:homoserine O-acetyltransferase [Magnetococcales bacterium]HAT49095.1 homoserine O-acetyltransferase [Alphaproteobacteria bacterium]
MDHTSSHRPDSGQSAQSIGLVTTQTVTLFEQGDPLKLDSGATLQPITVAYETYGTPNDTLSNVILICHALSGNAHAAGRHHPDETKTGWWDGYIGPGKPFDTNRFFVLCSNNLGGCDGTSGPSSIDPKTNKPYALNFPLITIGDIARLQKALLDHLGIKKVLAVAGGSMGGMIALQWALDYPECVGGALIIASTPRLSAQNIAFNAVARQAITQDPDFNNGDYYHGSKPERGLSVARMMAHITYLSEKGLHEKFGRRLQNREQFSFALETDFAVESYLKYQGSTFGKKFDANTYLYITKSMDYFDPFPDPETTAQRLQKVHARLFVMSFDTDWRFDSSRSKELVRILNLHQKNVSYQEFHSPHGHDSFLLPDLEYSRSIATFINRLYDEELRRRHHKDRPA